MVLLIIPKTLLALLHAATHCCELFISLVDLGVRFDTNLMFRDHISEKINKAYSILGIIKRLHK